jgi:lipopolysaccharide/colanic/teichoic acid biosynthesis glycosyltransferase
MDVLVSTTLLLLLSPLLLLVSLAIKLTSRGPIIFTQLRAGQGGRPFRFYKFRSMYADADAAKEELRTENEAGAMIFKIRNDRRVTPLGRFLRKSSMDELPQLWNVLKGDMTLVGPRPPTLDEVRNYKAWHRNRLAAPMGLTCIREVSGRSEVPFEDWVRMDLRYLASRSFLTDLKLLFRTILAVLSGRGAY